MSMTTHKSLKIFDLNRHLADNLMDSSMMVIMKFGNYEIEGDQPISRWSTINDNFVIGL